MLYETLAADGSTLQVNVDNTAVALLLIAINRSLEDEHVAVTGDEKAFNSWPPRGGAILWGRAG
ncbi:MAG TPA: hypothetical protein VI094_23565 [Propionibacteriaceae bacterium]